MAEQITTAAELDALLAAAGEMAEPVVVREGFRVWILTEDEDGRWWAWSWREDDEEGLGRRVESLRLPLAILHPRPDAPAPSDEEALVERLRGSADAWWSEYDRELRAHEETRAALAAVTAERDALAARSPQPAPSVSAGRVEAVAQAIDPSPWETDFTPCPEHGEHGTLTELVTRRRDHVRDQARRVLAILGYAP
ncbi:hypothetical protein [Cellulomonas palmilytica]|uniref:hypothetical protein n=1 Tax=Cellulomonas palmilytica TaxID=2608402 RepID=UPI001F1B8A09|nr:hypothetical protein [Cellulomonas palmilytica]UJP39342.1 hypothetical protein F1D97_13505 [Cellulomonas palmilytica]